MMNATDKLIESFASKLTAFGVPILEEDNRARLGLFEDKLPKRLPPSFEALLSRYSFPAFNIGGISLFAWDSASNDYTREASAPEESYSELLLPARYVQIGRPDTGDFDAVCFDLKGRYQNREYAIVQVDHEDILRNQRIRVSQKLWPSFRELVYRVLYNGEPVEFF
jgi:hypothetical protein